MSANTLQIVAEIDARTKRFEQKINAVDKRLATMGVAGAKSVGRIDGAFARAARRLDAFSRRANAAATKWARRGAIAAISMGGAAVYMGMQYEKAMAGVQKTADMTGEELAKFKERLVELSNNPDIPGSARELMGYAAAAGQLGVRGSENLERFAVTMAKLGQATDIGGEEGAMSLTQLINVSGGAIENVDKVAAVITNLGNSTATTEKPVLLLAQRIAAAGREAKMNLPQILAWGAAISSTGIEAEAGGTAFSQILNDMGMAVSGRGRQEAITKARQAHAERMSQIREQQKALTLARKRAKEDYDISRRRAKTRQARSDVERRYQRRTEDFLEREKRIRQEIVKASADMQAKTSKPSALSTYARVAGMDAQSFRDLFSTDASESVRRFLRGLNQMRESGGNVNAVLQDLGITEVRQMDVLKRLAGTTQDVEKATRLAREEWKKATALDKETNAQMETRAAKLKKIRDASENLLDAIDDKFKNAVAEGADGLHGLILELQNWVNNSPEAARFFDRVAETIGNLGDSAKTAKGYIEAMVAAIQSLPDFGFKALGLGPDKTGVIDAPPETPNKDSTFIRRRLLGPLLRFNAWTTEGMMQPLEWITGSDLSKYHPAVALSNWYQDQLPYEAKLHPRQIVAMRDMRDKLAAARSATSPDLGTALLGSLQNRTASGIGSGVTPHTQGAQDLGRVIQTMGNAFSDSARVTQKAEGVLNQARDVLRGMIDLVDRNAPGAVTVDAMKESM